MITHSVTRHGTLASYTTYYHAMPTYYTRRERRAINRNYRAYVRREREAANERQHAASKEWFAHNPSQSAFPRDAWPFWIAVGVVILMLCVGGR